MNSKCAVNIFHFEQLPKIRTTLLTTVHWAVFPVSVVCRFIFYFTRRLIQFCSIYYSAWIFKASMETWGLRNIMRKFCLNSRHCPLFSWGNLLLQPSRISIFACQDCVMPPFVMRQRYEVGSQQKALWAMNILLSQWKKKTHYVYNLFQYFELKMGD